MKKFTYVIIAILICTFFAGCTIDVEISKTGNTNRNIPNAKEFPEIDWPTFGIITKVPTINWSNRGRILADSETLFWGEVGYSTLEDYTSYVEKCQNAGYTENSYNDVGYMYYGEDSEGRAVQVTYNQYSHYIAIQVTHNAETWNKWWLDKE